MSAGAEETAAIVADVWDPYADYYPVRKFPEARPCHGPEQIRAFVVPFLEAWSHATYDIRELIEIGGDRVLVSLGLRTEGRGSQPPLEGSHYTCMWLRHGRFFRVEDHLTLEGALHALGLEGKTLEAAGLARADQ
jgi:hypothetical protein